MTEELVKTTVSVAEESLQARRRLVTLEMLLLISAYVSCAKIQQPYYL